MSQIPSHQELPHQPDPGLLPCTKRPGSDLKLSSPHAIARRAGSDRRRVVGGTVRSMQQSDSFRQLRMILRTWTRNGCEVSWASWARPGACFLVKDSKHCCAEEPRFFRGSVAENLAWGLGAAKREKLEEVGDQHWDVTAGASNSSSGRPNRTLPRVHHQSLGRPRALSPACHGADKVCLVAMTRRWQMGSCCREAPRLI